MGLECGWRHAQKRCPENLEDFQKDSVEFRPWCWEGEIGPCRQTFESLPLGHGELSSLPFRLVVEVLQISTDRDLEHYKMCRVFVGSDSMVSIVRIVSQSLCRITEVKKLINAFVPEQQSPPAFVLTFVFCIWLYLNMLCICIVYHRGIQHS